MSGKANLDASLGKAQKKSCANCAFLGYSVQKFGMFEFTVVAENIYHDNHTKKANACFHKRWQFAQPQTEGAKKRLEEKKEENPGRTVFMTTRGKFWILEVDSCDRFCPVEERGNLEIGTFWDDQQHKKSRREGWIKFWVPISISFLALILSSLSLWRTWE